MAKVLVLYYSCTGNTEEMAQAVAKGAEAAGAEVTLKKVEDASADELLDYDGIIMGSPTYYGQMAAECKKILDESVKFHGKLAGKVGGAFSSAANVGGGNETTVLSILEALLIHGMVVEGTAKGDHYGPVAVGKPDKRAMNMCRDLGMRVAKLAEKIS